MKRMTDTMITIFAGAFDVSVMAFFVIKLFFG